MFLSYVRDAMNGQWTNGHHNSQMSSLEITKIVFKASSEIKNEKITLINYWKKILLSDG